ncbi:MAG: hypothetical protein QG658_605 [Patescibacteria group bacterium]|nr:hypothetical protein [Patescibacteria group bacterium]
MSTDPTLLRPEPITSKNRGESLINPQHPASSNLKKKSRKKTLIIAGAVLLVLALGAGAFYAFGKKAPETATSPQPTEEVKAEASPAPTTKPSVLTGVLVEPAVADKPVMASIIENMAGRGGARPQSGLTSAGVVYEALAEGGITRYLALWQADTPTDIGPVRSLRPVFFYTAMEYGTPTAHAGGSSDALSLAQDNNFKNVEALGGLPFRRVSSRIAPHNLYVYGEKYAELVANRGWNKPASFNAWPRKDDAPSDTPTATVITANFSSADYRAVFRYDAATNSYLREIGGKADVDAAANNKQVNPKTVIIVKASAVAGKQKNGKPKTDIDIIGKGTAYIFQDGTVTEVNWVKNSATDRMQFLDSVGAPVALNRGQAWVSIVPTTLPPTWK